MQPQPVRGYRFSGFTLDLARRRLSGHGQDSIVLSGRAFDVLAYLLACRDRMVTKRELLSALREAFVTPIEPEDLFALSRGIDRILNYATDLVEESEAMASPPDEGITTIAGLLCDAVRHLDDALSQLGTDGDHATASADAAIAAQHQLETACYAGMVGLLSVEDRTERITRRELYRRSSRISEAVVDVAERIVYAVVKQS